MMVAVWAFNTQNSFPFIFVGHEVPGVVAVFCVCLYDPSRVLSFVNVWMGLGWVIYLSREPSVLLQITRLRANQKKERKKERN